METSPLPTLGIAFFIIFYFSMRDSASFPDLESQGLGKLLCNAISHSEKDLLVGLPLFALASTCPLDEEEEEK